MRNRDHHRENVVHILAICLLITTTQQCDTRYGEKCMKWFSHWLVLRKSLSKSIKKEVCNCIRHFWLRCYLWQNLIYSAYPYNTGNSCCSILLHYSRSCSGTISALKHSASHLSWGNQGWTYMCHKSTQGINEPIGSYQTQHLKQAYIHNCIIHESILHLKVSTLLEKNQNRDSSILLKAYLNWRPFVSIL